MSEDRPTHTRPAEDAGSTPAPGDRATQSGTRGAGWIIVLVAAVVIAAIILASIAIGD